MLDGLGQDTWQGAGEGDGAGCHFRPAPWGGISQHPGRGKKVILALYEALVGLVERWFSFDTLCSVNSKEYWCSGVNWCVTGVTGGQLTAKLGHCFGQVPAAPLGWCSSLRGGITGKFHPQIPAGYPWRGVWCWAVPGKAQGAPHRALEVFPPLPEPTQVGHRALGGTQLWGPSAPLGQQREESNTTPQLLFSSQGMLCQAGPQWAPGWDP